MRYIVITLVIFGIVYFISSKWNYVIQKSVYYKMYLDKRRVFVNDNVKLTTEIINRKIVPMPWIKIRVEMPIYFKFNNSKVQDYNKVKNIFKIVTSLLCFEKLKRYDSFKCSKRGVYRIKFAEIEMGDFLGATKAKDKIHISEELIVYPKVKKLVDLIDVPKSLQGYISVRRWIVNDTTQVVGVRKYSDGDGFNTIDWKASAKNNELYVKKFDFTSDPSVMIFLDIQTEDIHWKGLNDEFVENGIDIAASLMDQALKEKISIGYTANAVFENENEDIFIYPSNSSRQREKILDALAKTTYQRTYTIIKLINERISSLGKYCTIIMLLSFISDELIKNLNYYAQRGHNIKIILLDNRCNTIGINKDIEIIYPSQKGVFIENVR